MSNTIKDITVHIFPLHETLSFHLECEVDELKKSLNISTFSADLIVEGLSCGNKLLFVEPESPSSRFTIFSSLIFKLEA